MSPLISRDNTQVLWAVMIAGTGTSIYLEQNYRWAAKVSAPVLALVIAMLLSNFKVMPTESPAYEFVGDYLVPLALPLLLFRANAMRIARTTGRMFLAFHISSLGTIIGAFLATLLLRHHVPHPEHAAGIMTASYIVGAINFFATKESYHVSSDVTGPLLVADNFVMAGLFIVLLWIAGSAFFHRYFPHPHTTNEDTDAARNMAAEHWQRKGISLIDLAKALMVAFVAVAAAKLIGLGIHRVFHPDKTSPIILQMLDTLLTNRYVLITGVALFLATVFHRSMSAINGPEELGGYMLYLFLFAIGLPADLKSVFFKVPMFFVFCTIIAGVNLIVTLVVGKLLNMDLEELLLCVNASVGGPPTAAAMAISKGWPKLVLPAILVGIWGYVIGTGLGILVAEALLRM